MRMLQVLEAFNIPSFHYTNLKIQKTLPTQGYHVWHIEHNIGFSNEPRALVYSVSPPSSTSFKYIIATHNLSLSLGDFSACQT